jgi:hypothetical protein
MIRSRLTGVMTLTLALSAAHTLQADVRSDQKSKVEFGGGLGRMMNMFGGKAAKDGVESSIAVKGDRKATLNESTGQIIDLVEEKVYDLDIKKKTYKVTTFAELRRRIEEARKKAEEDARKDAGKQKDEPKADPNAKQMEVDFVVKNTGQKKTINGFDTHEAVMTITVREKGKTLEQGGGMVLTSDMWLAPTIAAMKEIQDFDIKYAQKLYGGMMSGVSAEQMAMAMAMYPMMKDAVAKMNAEGGKIEGTPIQTVTTMDAVPSAEEAAEQAKAGDDDSKTGKTPTSVGGMLGGFMAKKMQKKPAGDGETKGRTSFMTTTTDVLKVTTDVAAADVAIPAGFKENK